MQNNNTLAGKIEIKAIKRGLAFYAFNHQFQKWIHVGTKVSQVYEKCTAILHSPEPSISLAQSELAAVVDSGAVYIRFIPGDKSRTYSISVIDFQQHGIPYHNPHYGPQWRVPLTAFQSIGAVKSRNALIDNPTQARAEMVLPRQLPLFG